MSRGGLNSTKLAGPRHSSRADSGMWMRQAEQTEGAIRNTAMAQSGGTKAQRLKEATTDYGPNKTSAIRSWLPSLGQAQP
jgi:hypothetical protein